jgi:predicted ABC-type ATPase
MDDLYARAANVPNEREAVIAGGLPGAGKSTVLENYADVDRSRFLTVDPDEIKTELAWRGLIPAVEGLSPMEASDLAHEESSYIAKGLAERAQAEGKNMVWDITMSSRSSTESRIDDLRSAGYTRITGIFVDIPLEKSAARAEARHRIGQDEYRAGRGEGGRLLPPEVIRSNEDPVWGSLNRKVFEEVKHRFDAWSIYDNSTDGRPPVLVDSSEEKGKSTWPAR